MPADASLAGLRDDACGRVTGLPPLSDLVEDAGRQRLAAYYLYAALLAGVLTSDDLAPAHWPPKLADPMRQLGLTRLAPRTWPGLCGQLSPGEQALCALAGGAIALAAHGGKTAARVAVTPSPEPLSNIGLSLGEDALAIFLVWFATKHPYAAAEITLVALVVVVLAIRFVWRAMRALFSGAEREIRA